MNENFPNMQNISTKKSRDPDKFTKPAIKEYHESVLNLKLTLRKRKLNDYIMETRMKKSEPKNIEKINSRKKYIEFKKQFEPEKIKETLDKIININNKSLINYLKDKKTIELIHLYSQHLNNNDNVKALFDINIEKIQNIFYKEIITDINSSSINFEFFDYYLIILGNLFIFKKSINDNKEKAFLSLLLNILSKNTNLEIYNEYNFDIINDTLWLIYLYIYFSEKENIYMYYPYIIKIVNALFINRFFDELNNFNKKNQTNKIIIKEIIYSNINIYLSIFENLIESNKNKKIDINIIKEDLQHCLDIIIHFYEFEIIKDIFNEDITNIISILLELTKNYFTLNLNKFYNIFISFFDKYKNYDYDNNKISQNLIYILYYLIYAYYEDNELYQILLNSDIIPLMIQYYLKNGSIINITLSTLNLVFKYPLNYHKVIIKSINYKLLDKVCQILMSTENNENIFISCFNILINAFFYLENYLKNPSLRNILEYFDLKIVHKIEQLLLNDNKDICEMASFLYKKFKNIE